MLSGENGFKRLLGVDNTKSYRTLHVDTEGGDFIAGGNGVYINTLMSAQADKLSGGDKIALITPAYTPDGKTFNMDGYSPFSFTADIYGKDGTKHGVKVNCWLKEVSENVHYYTIAPDQNHEDFFTTIATDQGTIEQIRSIPDRLKTEQTALLERIKVLPDQIRSVAEKMNEDNIAPSELSELARHYQKLQLEFHDAKERLKQIFQGKDTNECSLYFRNAHFHELSAALVDYIQSQGIKIKVLHTHDYGNTMQHVKSNDIATVNTFHSEPGKGLLPYYLEEKVGEDSTQRGNGMAMHHMMYTVSPEYEQWLVSRRNPNSQYSIPMHARGRVTHVTSIPNKDAHGFHTIVPYLKGYCSENDFLKMPVGEKKKLAKQILSDKIAELNKGYHFDPNKRTLLFIGRVSKQKGSEFLEDIIKAAQTLDCNVLICGYLQQQDHEFSRDLIDHLKREYPWVPFFIGKDEQAYIGNLHRASSDIGVSMSFNESFGLTYSEFLCYGCHCVVSDVGGSRSAILNDPLCATMVPLYFGHEDKYLLSQQNRFVLASKALGFRRMGNDSRDELVRNWRKVEDEIDIYLDREITNLRTRIDELNDQIHSLNLNEEGSIYLLQEISQQHLDCTKKLDSLLSVNYEETKRVFRFHLLEAHWKLIYDSASHEKIYSKAIQQFSKEKWLSEIDGIYDVAQGMHRTQAHNAFILKEITQSNNTEFEAASDLRVTP